MFGWVTRNHSTTEGLLRRMTETPEKSLTEQVIFALTKFPIFLARNVGSLLLAILSHWETTLFVIGTGLITYATGSLVVVGAAILLYVFVRLLGDMAGTLAQQINFLALVLRDKQVEVVQLPEVLVREIPHSPSPGTEVWVDPSEGSRLHDLGGDPHGS
jgi:hypothetical protein